MKKKSLFILILVTAFTELIIFSSCQKKDSCNGCLISNKPPIAKAGPDRAIYLSDSSVNLDGDSSSDPDGSIALYSWTQIAGPNQSDISNSSKPSSTVNHLAPGNYQFELDVTDNGGLSAKDTVLIIVMAPAQ
jgi:PKD domain